MRARAKVAAGAVATAVVAATGAAALAGAWSAPRDAHPPCDQLPTTVAAAAALASHQPLSEEVEALGDGISVDVGRPCPSGQDRALVQVTYRSESEREAVADLLARRDGFGVPVHVVED